MNSEWHDLIQNYMAGLTSEEESQRLHEALKHDDELARLYLRYINLDVALEAEATAREQAAIPHAESSVRGRAGWFSWRPLTAAAAGVVIGLFGASLAWAYTPRRVEATATRLSVVADASFETGEDKLPSGFPREPGRWSGDASERVQIQTLIPKDGGRVLRFLHAEASAPDSPAEACDVYQLVDLRPLRGATDAEKETILELSASFLDARDSAELRTRFACHLYVFEGMPGSLHQSWPQAARDALNSGGSTLISEGGAPQWRQVTARCMLPPQADYALLKLSATRGAHSSDEAPEFGAQYVDDVKLTLKTQPRLPVRQAP